MLSEGKPDNGPTDSPSSSTSRRRFGLSPMSSSSTGARKPPDRPVATRLLCGRSRRLAIWVLGTGMDTQDTSPSVLLFFDKQRYLFNAGERVSREHSEDFYGYTSLKFQL